MLTIIRNWLDIRPESDMDEIFFYEDGWKEVMIRMNHAITSFPEAWWWQDEWFNLHAWTVSARKEWFTRSDRHLFVLNEGNFSEQLQYIFTPQGVINRYGFMQWEAQRAFAFAPIKKG